MPPLQMDINYPLPPMLMDINNPLNIGKISDVKITPGKFYVEKIKKPANTNPQIFYRMNLHQLKFKSHSSNGGQ